MKKEIGYTVLELMITVAIAGVVVAFALPSYQTMVKNNCMTTGTNALVASFQQARSEAVKRGTEVTITAGNAGDSGNEWGTGWSITIDEDRNGNGNLDTGEDYNGNGVLDDAAPVRNVSLTCQNTTINEIAPGASPNPADNTDNDTEFVYLPSGFIDYPGTFDVCDDRTGEIGRQITISLTGRPSTNSNYAGCP